MITSKHLIETQIPYHIRESNPLFTKFLEYYYEFLEQEKINQIIQDVLTYGNNELAEEYFLKNMFEELKILPINISANRQIVAKHIYDIYRSKGTDTGLKLLLKIIADVEVVINKPYDNVLKASDGIWMQENFITVQLKTGTIPGSFDSFSLIQNKIEYILASSRIEVVNPSTVRFYYTTNVPIYPQVNDLIQIKENDITVFVGIVIKSPVRIDIQDGGSGWSVGQIITFPGIRNNTIAKVSKIDSQGAITRISILEYGFDHSENEILEISPYGARPINARYTIDIETTAPNVRTHTLKIYDGTIGISESIKGYQIGFSNSSYFLSDYNIYDYNANETISVVTNIEKRLADSYITIEEWLESKATLVLNFGAYAKMPGRWQNDNSQLSNQFSVLQDNKYYQIYSYEIESLANPNIYKGTANLVHPAGTAMFTRHIIEQTVESSKTITPGIIT